MRRVFFQSALIGFLLLSNTACFADYLITLRYWRKTDHGTEEYTVVISLDDYFGKRVEDPVGLAPFLLRGRQRRNTLVDRLAESTQETYLEAVSGHANLYGSHAAEVAASIQQPGDIKKAPNSGVYVFKDGKLVLSYRVVAAAPGSSLPVIQTFLKANGPNAKVPQGEQGLTWRPVSGVPPVLDAGVIDVTQHPDATVKQVFQSGNLEVKSLFSASPEYLQLAPEMFNLTRWMFEYSPDQVPKDTKYANGAPRAGAFASTIYCDVYVNERESNTDLRKMYERMGFKVWSTERKEGSDLVHYYMYATPESMSQALADLQRVLGRHPGTALVEYDPALLGRMNDLRFGRSKDCRKIYEAIRKP